MSGDNWLVLTDSADEANALLDAQDPLAAYVGIFPEGLRAPTLASLASLLGMADERAEAIREPNILAGDRAEGAVVYDFPDDLVERLASIEEPSVAGLAARWAATNADVARWSTAYAEFILLELGGIARRARSDRKTLLMRVD